MIRRVLARLSDYVRLVRLSIRHLAGRRYYLAPLLPLLWPMVLYIWLAAGWDTTGWTSSHAQNTLIGLPLTILAVLLGGRIISGEVDRRTLEIAYTVPGGTHRVWLAKLSGAFSILLVSLILLSLVAWVFLTEYPPGAVYGALQGAVFYLVLSMTMAAVARSEATGALITSVILVFNWFITGFGGNQIRISPFFNPLILEEQGRIDAADLLARTVQNRVGFVLAIAAVIALGFARAERREKMLGS